MALPCNSGFAHVSARPLHFVLNQHALLGRFMPAAPWLHRQRLGLTRIDSWW